jgi:ComEC/Rec2-related protein
VVAEEPDIRDSGANYLVSVSGVVTGRRVRPVTGRVQIHTSRAVVLDYGDRVLVTGTLRASRNDKTLPYRDVLARRGIGSTMAYPRMLNEGPVDSGPAGWIVRLRQGLERNINAWLPEPEAALLIAIAIGSRSAALGNATGPLIATGLIHIIAISGIKVAMVAGTAYALLRRIPNRALTLVAALALLAVYVALTGDTVSGERSAIMWALVFIAAYLGRGTLSWQSLGMVAAAMVAVQPGSLWDPAFQLTALGTGSIIAFTQPLLRTFRLVPSPFKEAFCVTLAAQAGTTPVVIGSFHVLAVWGPIANAAVLPLLPLLIVLGFALGALAAVPALAVLVAGLAYALLRVVMLVATGLAVLPGTLPLSGVSAPLAFAYYALLTALSLATLRRANWAPPGRKPGNVTDVAFGFTLGAVVLTGTLLPSSALTTRLEWLGTGQALLLQSGGRAVLIDGSPRPFLLSEALGGRLGLRRHIDVIVVTDPRSNVAGLLDVLDHYSVGEVLDVGCEYPSTTYARWRAALRTRHIPVYALRTGVALTAGSASLTTVGPDAVYPQPRDSIGLLRVRVPGRTIFLAGAASQREMTEAVFRTVRLQADILVLDAGTAPPASFLRHVGASRIVRPSIADHLSHAATTVFESH